MKTFATARSEEIVLAEHGSQVLKQPINALLSLGIRNGSTGEARKKLSRVRTRRPNLLRSVVGTNDEDLARSATLKFANEGPLADPILRFVVWTFRHEPVPSHLLRLDTRSNSSCRSVAWLYSGS